MKAITEKVKQLSVVLVEQKKKINSAAHCLKLCDAFRKTKPPPLDGLESFLQTCKAGREKTFLELTNGNAAVAKIEEVIARCLKERKTMAKVLMKDHLEFQRQKVEMTEEKLYKNAKLYKERLRIQAKRQSF